MKNGIYLLLTVVVLLGAGCEAKKDVVITIDDIQITQAEFEGAFNMSLFPSTQEGRTEFLNKYVITKLILKEAEDMGLDKDPEFLNEIQMFWEKALLKLVLSKKSDELAALINIADQEILAYYQNNRERLFAGKELADVRDQIKWFIVQERQGDVMGEWAKSLKKESKIIVNYGRLGIQE